MGSIHWRFCEALRCPIAFARNGTAVSAILHDLNRANRFASRIIECHLMAAIPRHACIGGSTASSTAIFIRGRQVGIRLSSLARQIFL